MDMKKGYSGPYVKKQDEEVLLRLNRSLRSSALWILFSSFWIFLGLFYPILLLLGVIILAVVFIKTSLSEYVITAEGIYAKEWVLLDRRSGFLPWKEVEEVSLKVNNMGGLLGFGDVIVGPFGDERLILKGVAEPKKLVDYIEDKMR